MPGVKRHSQKRPTTTTTSSTTTTKHTKGLKRLKTSKGQAATNTLTGEAGKNRFRFKTFNERIEDISIDSFRKLTGLHGLRPSDNSSWFLEALEAWKDLNYTNHFQALADRLSRLAISMAALLFNKQAIVDALIEAIETGRRQKVGNLLPPACNLVAMLMQDLGEQEGYEYFKVLFKVISKALVDCQEAEDIEACFSCLIYLLKSMKRRALDDITNVCGDLFVAFFGQAKKVYLRKLACYSYSYLIRQSEKFEALDALTSLTRYPLLVKDCVIEAICLTVIDPASGKQRECFEPILKRCSHSCNFFDELVIKIADRLSNADVLLAAVPLGKLSDDSFVHIFTRSKLFSINNIVTSLGDRLAENAAMSAALISKFDFEKTLSCRASLIKVIASMSDNTFLSTLSILGELKWPYVKLLFSLENRPINDQLLCCLASLHYLGVDLDWNGMRTKYLETCPEASLEFKAAGEYCVKEESRLELSVATLSQMLKAGTINVPTEHLDQYIHHPAVFCNLKEHHDIEFLLLFLTSSHVQVHRHALVLLRPYYATSKVYSYCTKVDSIPATFDTYRDRIMALKQFELAVDLSDHEATLAICFLLGCLHVNLTLLWPETFRLLSILSSKHSHLFTKLFRKSFECAVDKNKSSKVYHFPAPVESRDLKVIADTVARRISCTEASRMHFASLILQTEKYAILDSDALPVWLKMAASHPSIAEACQHQLRYMLSVFLQDTDAHPDLLKTIKANFTLIIQSTSLCNKYVDGECRSYFNNCAMKFLASGDAKVQSHALSLVLSLRRSSIHAEFAEKLKALLDHETGRDQLLTISSEIERWSSSPAWSEHLLPVLIRLLYGKMNSKKKGVGVGRSNVEQRRKIVLSSIAGWPSEACEYFVTFLAEPSTDQQQMAHFLSMIGPVFTYMSRSLSHTLFNKLIHSVLDIVATAEGSTQKGHSRLRSLAYKRLLTALSKALVVDENVLERIRSIVIEPRLSKFKVELIQSRSSFVDLLVFLADSEHVQLIDGAVMAKVTAAIASSHIKRAVLQSLMKVSLGVIARNQGHIFNAKELIDAVKTKTIADANARQGSVFWSGLKIMQSLSKFISSPLDAKSLIEMAVNVLGNGRLQEPVRCQLVILIHKLYLSNVESIADNQLVESLVRSLSTQFLFMKERESRLALVQAFSCFSHATPGWSSSTVFNFIQDLESWSLDVLDEPDYDRRIAAMRRLQTTDDDLSCLHWTPILYILLYCLQDPAETTLKSQACGLVEKCIKSGRVLCEQVLLPVIKKSVVHKDEAVRFEFFALLGKVVDAWGDDPKYAALKPLLMEGQEEANVFICFGHLQIHRRARAIRRIVELCEDVKSSNTDCSLYTGIILPMLLKYCLYNTDTEQQQVPAPLVTMEAIKTVGWLCGTFLSFSAYLRKVKQFVKQVKSPTYSAAEKQAVKLLPDMLSWFKFDSVDSDVVKDKLLPLLFDAMQGNTAPGSPASHISIAVAIGQLLSKLPQLVSDLCLPRLYCTLGQSLRSRVDSERHDARDALVKIVNLFPCSAGLVLEELMIGLTRGYQRHVLAFTLHSILSCNSLIAITDHRFIEQSMSIILDDTLGVIATEKNAEEWTGKLREVRECKSFSSISILVAKIDCQTLLSMVLGRILVASQSSNHFEEQLTKLMDAISTAIVDYPSIKLLWLCHELVNPTSLFFKDACNSKYNQLFHQLGLKIISSVIKRVEKEDNTKQERYEYLEQLCRLVVKWHWLESADSSSIVLSMKLICLLLLNYSDLPVICDGQLLTRLLHSAFELVIKSSSHHQSNLIAISFKYIAIILRDHPEIDITEGQVRALLQYVTAHLGNIESQQLTFALIKAMLNRKVVSADLYTLMIEIRESSVTAGSIGTRANCVQCFLIFVKEYPMAAKRLKEHAMFYISNLGYSGEGGRMSCLHVLEGLVKLLAEDCLEELSEELVKALVLRIANEEVEGVKLEAERVATLIATILTGRSIDSLSNLGMKWIASERMSVKRAGWILLSVLLPTGSASRLLAAAIDTIPDLSTHDHSDCNAQLIASALSVLQKVELDLGDDDDVDGGPLVDLMLFPNLVIRKAINQVLLASTNKLSERVFDNAFKQIAESLNVHGMDVADLSIQLLLKSSVDYCEQMERLARRADTSQQTVHVGSCLKYFGALITDNISSSTGEFIIKSAQRVITTKSSPQYSTELKQLAQQVLDLLRKKIGDDQFEQISSKIMATHAQLRQKRKATRKQMAVTNPGLLARIKSRQGRK